MAFPSEHDGVSEGPVHAVMAVHSMESGLKDVTPDWRRMMFEMYRAALVRGISYEDSFLMFEDIMRHAWKAPVWTERTGVTGKTEPPSAP